MMFKHSFTAAVATVLGAALGGLFLWRSVHSRKRKVSKSPDISAERPPPTHRSIPLPSVQTLLSVPAEVVSAPGDWDRLWPALQQDLSLCPVLGLDCEWVSLRGKTSAVSLLQLATCSGRCLLLRLQMLKPLPQGLVSVLSDTRVLKVGVGCLEDGKRLAQDHDLTLRCSVDLRCLALRERRAAHGNGLSLKSLASDLLDVSLDKPLELRCSDWEADVLSPEQVTYAANDAQISIALFFNLLGINSELRPPEEGEGLFSSLASQCQGLVDLPFRGRCSGEDEGQEKKPRRSRKITVDSPESGDQQVPDPRRNKRKPLGVGYSVRKSPLYDNCFLHAPDGQPLCTCDKKKAKWYLEKGIGELLSEEPFIVRLLFEPSGRPDSQKDYYLTAKANLCVVCGKAESYIRKNVVPHEYRRHFPAEMKDHNSHDILLLCTSCHAASNVHDGVLKQRLAEDHLAPQGCEEGVRLLEDCERRRVRSAARALLSASDGMPAPRREELTSILHSFFCDGQQQISEDMLQKAASLETRVFNESYVPHGLKVVRAYATSGLRGLMELERCWRQHFLTSMKPRHLPPLWSVSHNHNKYLRKYGENLPILLN